MSVRVALLTLGARESTRFNNIFTICNMSIVIYVVTCGVFRGKSLFFCLPVLSRSVINSFQREAVADCFRSAAIIYNVAIREKKKV